jgi:hypothetical protein
VHFLANFGCYDLLDLACFVPLGSSVFSVFIVLAPLGLSRVFGAFWAFQIFLEVRVLNAVAAFMLFRVYETFGEFKAFRLYPDHGWLRSILTGVGACRS